jgi:hypothetical protein
MAASYLLFREDDNSMAGPVPFQWMRSGVSGTGAVIKTGSNAAAGNIRCMAGHP